MTSALAHRAAAALAPVVSQLCIATAAAQCANPWLPGQGVPGVYGAIHAAIPWDPDGPGPQATVLAIGGYFLLCGEVQARNVATWNPATGQWSALGLGPAGNAQFNGTVHALAAMPNGELIAGGEFTSAGGAPATHLARWDGTTWHGFFGIAGPVRALAALPGGDLLAGGTFTTAGGVPAQFLARWNGAWSEFAGGTNSAVMSLAVLPGGDVVAGGYFTSAGGTPCSGIAQWNGTSWSDLGGGVGTGTIVTVVRTTTSGGLVAGGNFTSIGGTAASRIAQWNGAVWSPLGTGVDQAVYSLATLGNGDIVAGGTFAAAGGVAAARVARWDGTAWHPLGAGVDRHAVLALAAMPGGDLFACGGFGLAGNTPALAIARWDGVAWHALGSGTTGRVRCSARLPNGDVVVAGEFTSIEGVAANRVARSNGTSWAPLGSGLANPVTAAAVMPNGDVVVAETVPTATLFLSRIVRWNGAAWSPLGTGTDGNVFAVAGLPNGDVVAAGSFLNVGGIAANNIARWDGSTWSPMGTGLGGGWGKALLVLPNGALAVGGSFANAGGIVAPRLATWNGGTWSAFPFSLNGEVTTLTTLASGGLLIGGEFNSATGPTGSVAVSRIARWENGAVHALGAGLTAGPTAVLELTAGGIVAGGRGQPTQLLRWTGGPTWTPLGTGLVSLATPVPTVGIVAADVWALALLPGDDLLVGGSFHRAGASTSAFVARLTTTCPALATSYGAGCTSSAGPVALVATALPWLGASYRSTATGLPATALAVDVFGFGNANVPLASLLPQGVPGCFLLATPDALRVQVPVAGAVHTELTIPTTVALIGAQLFHQVVPIELGAAAAIVAVTGSNGLHLTVGSF